jgi:chemotaxis protein CheD
MGGSPQLPGHLIRQNITVGVGDVAASNHPNTTLSTYALGSCIGLILYDPVACSGGLLHLMLPEASINPTKAAKQPAMFADTGFVELMKLMAAFKAQSDRLRAFLAGGACMSSSTTGDVFQIGLRNIEKTKIILNSARIPIMQESLGGTNNRTLHFNIQTGMIDIKMCGTQTSLQLR